MAFTFTSKRVWHEPMHDTRTRTHARTHASTNEQQAALAQVNFFCLRILIMARAVQKVALKCEEANESGVLGKSIFTP